MNELALHGLLLGQSYWLRETISTLDPTHRFTLLLIGVGCATVTIISVVAIVSSMTQSMHRTRSEAALKREMLDRGMAADEIVKVIEATPPKDFVDREVWNRGRKKSA